MSQVICPNCGKTTASARKLPRYHYKESGLDNVWLHGGVTETTCAACGKKFVRIWKESQLLQVIALELLMGARHLTGPEFRFLRRACGMSQEQFASALKCRRRATVAEREAKQEPGLSFPEEVGIRLVLLKSFNEHLSIPGNSALEASHLEKLWIFSTVLREFATSLESVHGNSRITLEVHEHLWTMNKKGIAA